MGFNLRTAAGPDYRIEIGYGSTVSFVGAALLVVLAITRIRPVRPDRHLLATRTAPIAACVAYLAVIVLPWWDVLPRRLTQYQFFLAPFSWLTIAGVLVGVHLLLSWLRRATDTEDDAGWLVALPLFMLALIVMRLIAIRGLGFHWGAAVVVGLCLLLAFFGRVERRGGLRNLKIPGILRLDRIE